MKICIVDSRVDPIFLNSVQDDVEPILLDYNNDSFKSLLDKFSSAESIAYVAHGTLNPTYSFFKGDAFDMKLKDSWKPFFDFLKAIKGLVYFDFLGCNLASNDDWLKVFTWINEETGVKVRASTDETGNLASGGNWILEYGHNSVDAKELYFTNLDSFKGLLGDITYTATLSSPNTTICVGSATTLNVSISGGTPPYIVVFSDVVTYNGTTNRIVTSNTRNLSVSVSPIIDTIYTLTRVTDYNSKNALIDWKIIKGGSDYSEYIKVDGTRWVQGINASGQLGDNTINYISSPVQIGTGNWEHISAGKYHTIAIKTDGTLWSWGLNDSGQLGDGTIVNKLTPVQIGTDNTWANISAGGSHTIATKADGTLWAWGLNDYGQLGDGTIVNKLTPVQIGTDTDWRNISAGENHTIATKTDYTLWAWGLNNSGQLGDGTIVNKSVPTKIGIDTDWVNISAGGSHTIATKIDYILWAWGNNDYGQLGINSTDGKKLLPVKIGSDTDYWASISAGTNHTIATKNDGTLWAWGNNDYGQLGINSTDVKKLLPVQIGSETDWGNISAGENHTVAKKIDYTLWAWGNNDSGQLGDGSLVNKLSPVEISVSSIGDVYNISTGYGHTIITYEISGTIITIWASGLNNFGQLGDGTTVNKSSLVRINTSRDKNWELISAHPNGSHTIATKTDGTLWSWGHNDYGQLGIGDDTTVDILTPVQIGNDKKWANISAGKSHTVATQTGGTLWAWGRNEYGQLGRGGSTTDNQLIPVQIGNDENWRNISAGEDYTIATKTDGTLWAWGLNDSGQLGDFTNFNRSEPVKISDDKNWANISAGKSHSIATKTDGSLWAWGNNDSGQLGINSTDSSLKHPLQIGTDMDWANISAGGSHSIATKNNGKLFAWGLNTSGQLGDGITGNKSTPTQIGTDMDWANISAGENHTIATKISGKLISWGSGSQTYIIDPLGVAITVIQTMTVTTGPSSSTPFNTPYNTINKPLIIPIVHTTTHATGIGKVTGLPLGVIASWANDTITISGTPTESGTFNYSIQLVGDCGTVFATGTIKVNEIAVLNVYLGKSIFIIPRDFLSIDIEAIGGGNPSGKVELAGLRVKHGDFIEMNVGDGTGIGDTTLTISRVNYSKDNPDDPDQKKFIDIKAASNTDVSGSSTGTSAPHVDNSPGNDVVHGAFTITDNYNNLAIINGSIKITYTYLPETIIITPKPYPNKYTVPYSGIHKIYKFINIPENIDHVNIVAIGGGGSSGLHAKGGSGARVTTNISVQPDNELILSLFVGGGGSGIGDGGDATIINYRFDKQIIAGGGGGSGGNQNPGAGGNAGGNTDGSGSDGGNAGKDGIYGGGGYGGNQSSGGQGGGISGAYKCLDYEGGSGGNGIDNNCKGGKGGKGLTGIRGGKGDDGIDGSGNGGGAGYRITRNPNYNAFYNVAGGGGGGYGGGGGGGSFEYYIEAPPPAVPYRIFYSGGGGGGGGGSIGPSGTTYSIENNGGVGGGNGGNGSIIITFVPIHPIPPIHPVPNIPRPHIPRPPHWFPKHKHK